MANRKIRQEANILNREFVCTGVTIYSDETAKCDGDSFNGESLYFEVVGKNLDTVETRRVYLDRDSDSSFGSPSVVIWCSIPALTTTWTRIRSPIVSLHTTDIYYKVRHYEFGDPGDVLVKSAKIIILQNAAEITDTQTQIEIGQYATIVPAAANTWYQIPEPKYWKYEASKWDATTKTVKIGITFGCEDDKESYNFGLYDVTDADYAGGNLQDLITGVSTEAATYYESADILSYLEDGHVYCLAYEGDDTKDDMYFYNAKIIFTLSDGTSIDALQTEYLLINDAQTDTGSQEYMTLHDADEWDDGGGNEPTFYHEHSADSAGSNTKLEDSGGDITDSSITGTGLQRSSAITLDDDEEIDANIVTA